MSRRFRARGTRVVPALILLLCVFAVAKAQADAPSKPAATAPPVRTWENYYGAWILPDGRSVVVGDKGLVMFSDDKGQTWKRQTKSKNEQLFNLYSVAFTSDGSRGWVVGDGGAIFRTDDRGKTWTPQENKQPAALLKVAVIDANKACAVGEHGVVLCTADGGTTWKLSKFEDFVFFDIAFTDPNNGWAVGEFATTLHTANGGQTWTVQNGAKRTISADPYFAIGFLDAKNGLVTGLNGIDEVTTDGGKTWKAGTMQGDNHSMYAAVRPPSTDDLYLGGADGSIAVYQQGKATPVPTDTSNSITSLAFSPKYDMAVGIAGTILKSDDGGKSWKPAVAAAQIAQAQAQ